MRFQIRVCRTFSSKGCAAHPAKGALHLHPRYAYYSTSTSDSSSGSNTAFCSHPGSNPSGLYASTVM